MQRFTNAVERLANGLGVIGQLTILAMIASMLYEVVARYAFNAPTLWAFDISYMLNGSIVFLGAAYSLRKEAHVRIDFLSQKMPLRAQQILNAAVYALVMVPITGALTWVAAGKALKAFRTGEVENVSPWAPLMWPFYTVIAIGLLAFCLQFLAEALKYANGEKRPGETLPDAGPDAAAGPES
ncbi:MULTISPECIES: TRAP transporter small permease subunit [unclassified Meridianimarinicoccus]|uniref:TRAP transporter small permease subunit n=1 Tax=unclassified Meridianimarinicoccus TaxID=2923344 RepID=UPI0018663D9F|nr:TRAP transporter small permease subunit [Fluviibacterium sp. MJW13]